MAKVLLVAGMPHQGMSLAAAVLRAADAALGEVRTDHEYVQYIEKHQPALNRPHLGGMIDSHYREHRHSIATQWHRHLAERVLQEAARYPTVVVEGWQLFDCADALVG